MSVLMLDIGGSNVKAMIETGGEVRKFPSGPQLTPAQMMAGIGSVLGDWRYDRVSIGYPGIMHHGRPSAEPLNLGNGWLNFDYDRAFGAKVRFINDAAMQALGNYAGGRMLFLGFGTSTGTTIIADDTIVPVEIGLIKLTRTSRFVDRLTKKALQAGGRKRWLKAVNEAIELLRDVFFPRDIVLGGGNAKYIDPLPTDCRQVENASAYVGALRLWEDADLFAHPLSTTWRIERRHG
jgi:predicted NBD/HSP70 family sugar kinase